MFPGSKSEAQKHELASIAATYAAGTNRIAFSRPVRYVRLYLAADSANKFLYVVAANAEVTTPATPLAAAGSRYRFPAKTLANDGSIIDIAFDFEVNFLYFLSSTGTIDAFIVGWETY